MPVSKLLTKLHSAAPMVGPSLLACDFADLRREIQRVEEAGARILHLDIMDGHFVPNISFGIPVVEAVRRSTNLPLDVHLMISEPARYVASFRQAGADMITVHIEAVPDPRELLDEIRATGAVAGLTLNPPTPLHEVEAYLDYCDLVLVMSVMAGFGGQEFDPVALEKLRHLRKLAGPDLLLSVDGGINRQTIGQCAAAGADLLVAGSAVFSQENYGQIITELKNLAELHRTTKV
jgi:ribulose-phosphate 3-epimerase